MSEPFNKLVKLAARAFYDDITTKADNQSKSGRHDNRGIAVVILDALTRRQWVREEDLAKELMLHSKQLRRALRFFEEERLITREHRKETARGVKLHNAAIAATGDGQQIPKDGEEKIKLHTHSYCCLDYAQIYDVVRYKLYRIRKKLKDELDNKNSVQEYLCPRCGKRYNALDALMLISVEDECFRCESCNEEVVADNDKFVGPDAMDGDDNAKWKKHEKLKDTLNRMEIQLKPLVDHLNRIKDLPVPEFGSLQAWETRARAASLEASLELNSDDRASSRPAWYDASHMPFIGETKVEIAFSGADSKVEDTKPESRNVKVLPPWLIKQGMDLTREQRGNVKFETDTKSNLMPESVQDVKNTSKDSDEKNLQEEYVKAYYAALVKKQEMGESDREKKMPCSPVSNGFATYSSAREVGNKSKREDDDIEWEEPQVSEMKSQNYKISDLNAEPEASDDDDIDWEEG